MSEARPPDHVQRAASDGDENGLIDARGVLGLQLTRKVRWDSDLVPDQPRDASLRLPGRTAGLQRVVHIIRTRTGIGR